MSTRAWLAVLVMFAAIPFALGADGGKEDAAKHSALEWLAHVDRGEHEASWKEAASIFKAQINAADWSSAVAAVRQPLGAVVERRFESAQYVTQLSGVPEGEYVVLQFRTRFANKADVVETVTPAMDEGKWRVSGYFVR